MRGEETQLAGCFNDQEEQLFVFPGTHSKHVTVKNGKAVHIKTYMTGEFFELLSAKSILAASVEKSADMSNEKSREAFEAGIDEGLRSNLLHSSFKVRTNNLFGKFAKPENYHYLSGLLISTEIKEIAEADQDITLVSNSYMRSHYEVACNRLLDKSSRLNIQNADEAMVSGQLKVLRRLLKEKRFSDVR
jgi:2-dehydro-3-deoxygalactonokinase